MGQGQGQHKGRVRQGWGRDVWGSLPVAPLGSCHGQSPAAGPGARGAGLGDARAIVSTSSTRDPLPHIPTSPSHRRAEISSAPLHLMALSEHVCKQPGGDVRAAGAGGSPGQGHRLGTLGEMGPGLAQSPGLQEQCWLGVGDWLLRPFQRPPLPGASSSRADSGTFGQDEARSSGAAAWPGAQRDGDAATSAAGRGCFIGQGTGGCGAPRAGPQGGS